MIIAGYPGIGKTTLANKNNSVIDLESSHFRGIKDWYKYYIEVAKSLSRQGFTVFVSTHPAVIERLITTVPDKYTGLIYPSIKLKDKWVEKAGERLTSKPSDKNYRAYVRVFENFEDDVKYFESYNIKKIEIDDIDYKLGDVVERMVS